MNAANESKHHSNCKPILNGQPITDWLYAGPFELNVSEHYHDNYNVSIEPYKPMILEAKRAFEERLQVPPAEGLEQPLFGHRLPWRLHRAHPSDKKVTWARFGVFARLLSVFAYKQIVSETEQTVTCDLAFTGSIAVAMNGKLVFENWQVGRKDGKRQFTIPLRPGVNHCLLLLLNVHLHCANSFTFILEADGLQSSLPLLGENQQDRGSIEADLASIYMEQPHLGMNEDIEVLTDEPIRSSGYLRLCLTGGDERLIRSERISAADWRRAAASCGTARLLLGNTADLPPHAAYTVYIDYETNAGDVIPGVSRSFSVPAYITGVPELEYTGRKRFLLLQYAHMDGTGDPIRVIHSELAKLLWKTAQGDGEGPELDIAAVERGIDYINNRYDCADFAIHGLLRMYALYKNSRLLPDELKDKMKRCILGFKYSTDEPGRSMMFMRSENHEMLFYSAEYLAGLLFPAELFPNSGQNGLFHAWKGRMNAERWIREKGTYGFMEWHSNTYYEEDMLSLLNLYDFAEENSYIRILARMLLDSICVMVASHSYQGVLATTHGRSYEGMILYPEQESMSHLNWLLFGRPHKLLKRCSIGAIALCGSSYIPAPELESIARSEEELFTKTRMGLFPHEGLGGVNCATYRTKDYMVSGLVESRMGKPGFQTHAGQALLDGLVPVFVTCFDNNSETTRPSYWGGNYRIPKTIVCRDVLAYIFRIDNVVGFTHCYFPMRQMEDCAVAGGWLFGRSREAYVAVYCSKPYSVSKRGSYKDRELLCLEKNVIWLIQMGSKAQYGSFDRFVEAVSQAELNLQGEDLTYVSPSQGLMELSWDNPCTCGGEAILDESYPLIENRFAKAEYGSGLMYLDLAGKQKILNFHI